jgi:hypothetical protein
MALQIVNNSKMETDQKHIKIIQESTEALPNNFDSELSNPTEVTPLQ